MSSLNMNGPYPFTADTINRVITRTLPGNFALGHVNDEGSFIVHYVGRADLDLKSFLLSLVGKTRYRQFKASYAHTPQDAFEKECQNYHDFNPPGNANHPRPPASTSWTCPYCKLLG